MVFEIKHQLHSALKSDLKGTYTILSCHDCQALVLLTANVEDIRQIARQFLPGPLADKLAEFVARAVGPSGKADSDVLETQNYKSTADPYTRLPIKKYRYDPAEKPKKINPFRNIAKLNKAPPKQHVAADLNKIRDHNKPKLPRSHEDDVPIKEAYDDYADKTTEEKHDDGKEIRKKNLEKYYDEIEEGKELKRFEVKKNERYDAKKNEQSAKDSGYDTQKFRRFSTIKRPGYDRNYGYRKGKAWKSTEPQAGSNNGNTQELVRDQKHLLLARASGEAEFSRTITTAKERNEFDQYDNFRQQPTENFYLTKKEANTAPETTQTIDTVNTTPKQNENEKLKVLEEYTEPPVVNVSAENSKFSRQQESLESDTNYDAFNEAKQPILESVLSQKLHGKAIATSGDMLLVDPNSETPWWEKDLVTKPDVETS